MEREKYDKHRRSATAHLFLLAGKVTRIPGSIAMKKGTIFAG